MALDSIFEGHEDLYEPSKIYLFGKPFKGLAYVRSDLARTRYVSPGGDNRLDFPPPYVEDSLLRNRANPEQDCFTGANGELPNEAANDQEPLLARIYSFSHEGHYCKLPKPMIYLVWGEGKNPVDENTDSGLPDFQTSNVGVEAKDWRFSSDIRVWKLDKNDSSLVLDFRIGELEEILLESFYAAKGLGGGHASGRMDMASRMDMNSRMDMTSRMDMSSRMDMASRMKMAGPHQG